VTRVAFELNGEPVEVEARPLRRLLDVLRDDLGFTGTKEGCGEAWIQPSLPSLPTTSTRSQSPSRCSSMTS
jgi:hypothetical protein